MAYSAYPPQGPGYPPYPGEPEPPDRSANRIVGIVMGLVVTTIVIAIIVVAVLFLQTGPFSSGSSEPAAASPSPTPDEQDEDDAEDDSENEEGDADDTSVDAADDSGGAHTDEVVEGWQGLAVSKRDIAYDVPPEWEIQGPGLLTGFEEEDPDAPFGYSPRVMMSGVAFFDDRAGDCEDAYPPDPAASGTSGAGEVVDTEDFVSFMANEWAEAAYEHDGGDPVLSAGSVESFESHGLEGHQITIDVDVADHECYPDTAQVRVASFVSPDGTDVYNFIIYADTSGDQAPDSDDLDTMWTTMRPLD